MKRFILLNEEKQRITKLYGSKGIILEVGPPNFSLLLRRATAWAGKNEDDIARLFKTSEQVLANQLDDIIKKAVLSKSTVALDDLQMKLMHAYNPSGLADNVPAAQQKVKNFLNGYAKSEGYQTWSEIRNYVDDASKHSSSSKGASASAAGSKTASSMLLKGQRVSNRWENWLPQNIDFTKMSNIRNMEELNKAIATGLKNGRYDYIPRGGFEKFGINVSDYGGEGFRGFIKDQLGRGAKINEVIPETGRWSINFVN